MSSKDDIVAAIAAKGDEIKNLKAQKPPTMKEDLAPLISELLALKLSYKEVTGEDFGGPAPVKEKKKAPVEKPAEEGGEPKGPSKKELNKLKKKEKKVAYNASESSSSGDAKVKPAKEKKAEDDGAVCPPLEGAIEGQVCTRFPPEPSGYLHIGHAKACLLNQYYAQRYNGKLLVRFDDTNPTKEKDEYEQAIIQDLASLDVHGDSVSHTSDHFALCEEYAVKMIKAGIAYMDDTPQEKMQAERMEHKESYLRNSSVEDNLRLFGELCKGSEEGQPFCLRAKMDMTSLNGTMRDPVMYRFNDTPHHQTGTKFKAYPTYDFACPIVDSVEGVTHALRTTEYHDRDEQYHWLQDAMGLRRVAIQSFGKMNFINTVLSKRKLNWFVEQELVEGWFDPRFPTIQGCVRRGVNIAALKSFIISQGASKRVITMEWDKFWAENKKVWEAQAHRYMGVTVANVVTMEVDPSSNVIPDGQMSIDTDTLLHPQKPEMGTRVMKRSNTLYLDQEDCKGFTVGEEVTLLRWGNFIIDEVVKDASGVITTVKSRHNAEATNFSKTKKATWLAVTPECVNCTLVEFDHLISKSKLAEDENFQDFVNPITKAEKTALCDPCVKNVAVGQVIQLERYGFYRCDEAAMFENGVQTKNAVLFYIPDGKATKPLSATVTSASVV